MAEATASVYDSSIRPGVKVLDIGAGTGQVAEQVFNLQSINYTKNI
jgi:ubiquinone/menaquinone biosynthesis C-methylase UbiE